MKKIIIALITVITATLFFGDSGIEDCEDNWDDDWYDEYYL
jgi:hypothetical protein